MKHDLSPEIGYIAEFKQGKEWFWLGARTYPSKTKAKREFNSYRKAFDKKNEITKLRIVKQTKIFKMIEEREIK